MTTLFHGMIHKEIEVYMDDVSIKLRKSVNYLSDLRKFFERLRRYNLKLNPVKYAFIFPIGKVLGFIISRKGIELDPSKIKDIQDLPPPKSKKDELCKKFTKIKFKHVPRIQNEFADALATFSSMIQHPVKNYIDHIEVEIQDPCAYCLHVDEEPDGKPRYYGIKRFLEAKEYLESTTTIQKRSLRRLENHVFHNGEVLYKRILDLGLLRCVDVTEAPRLLEEIHAGTCGPHMNSFILARKILRVGYFWMTVEMDNICYV
ncbi:uncharacterized protein [Nicotiana tomentosiformis]|uniref:uncharacterized protein n=1 Tax=Nicotiana tomentosiformis TaxID=4098 RepID=UPI00388C9C31